MRGLHSDLETAADVEEPDQAGAGVVDQARYLGDQVGGCHEETFLKIFQKQKNISETWKYFRKIRIS